MSQSVPIKFFDNYTKYRPTAPSPLWHVARVATLVVTLAVAALLAFKPDVGLKVFWGVLVPSLPMLFMVAPGLWRQVCPMAFMNQIPRTLGFSLGKDLPESIKASAFSIAVMLFILCVSLRVPVFNHAGVLVAVGLVGVLAVAFAGGYVYKGRSGWCGTYCPLGPIQRTYGQAPLAVVPNGFCTPCVGCQKNCYDFNPRAAVFSDVYDDDPRYASQRRFFMGLLPGLIAGFFFQGLAPAYGTPLYLGILLSACCSSAGLYWLLTTFLPINPYRVAALFGATAFGLFYWFSGPAIVHNVADLAGVAAPDWAALTARTAGLMAALALIASGLRSEWHYRITLRDAARAKVGSGRSALKSRAAAASGAAEVTDRATGITFQAGDGASLLDAVQAAGLKINYGCRAGVCGADAVAVCDGGENLSPPSEEELATLRRLGLEGRARLACVCQVKGPVVIDRDPHSSPTATAAAPSVPKDDRAKAAGIGRVVIVGNGVAGMGAAEALRRESPSVEITMVTNEPLHFYNRMAIGRLIYSGSGMDGLQLVPDAWYNSNNVDVHRNTVAAAIDRARRQLKLATGQALPYDKLVIATGARASSPDPHYLDHPNAFVLRSADDAQAIRTYVQTTMARRAVVIGGGVLGVEAADALHKLGLRVTLLQRADRLMNMQLDVKGAAKLTAYLEGIGIQVVPNVDVTRFDGAPLIGTAWLSHGPRVKADLFVACLGVQPNVFLAQQAGLEMGRRGVRVDASMRTSDEHIFAIGDVADIQGPAGLWPIGAAQANAAVAAMLGDAKPYAPPRIVLQLKCEGIDLRSYGAIAPEPGDEVFTSHPDDTAYWQLILRAGETVGGIYVGPPGSAKQFTRVLSNQIDLRPARGELRLGNLDALKNLT